MEESKVSRQASSTGGSQQKKKKRQFKKQIQMIQEQVVSKAGWLQTPSETQF